MCTRSRVQTSMSPRLVYAVHSLYVASGKYAVIGSRYRHKGPWPARSDLSETPNYCYYNPNNSRVGFLRVGRRIASKRRMTGAYGPSVYCTWAPFRAPSSYPGRHPMYVVYRCLPVTTRFLVQAFVRLGPFLRRLVCLDRTVS